MLRSFQGQRTCSTTVPTGLQSPAEVDRLLLQGTGRLRETTRFGSRLNGIEMYVNFVILIEKVFIEIICFFFAFNY